MNNSIRSAVFALLCCTAFAIFPGGAASVHAQSPSQDAVLAFEFYMGRLTSSEIAKANGMSDPAAALGAAGAEGNNGLKPDEVRRFFGAVSAPPSVMSLMNFAEGADKPEKIDFDFFVRMQYDDASLAKAAFAEMSKDSEKVMLAGKECYRAPPTEEDYPKNIAIHMCAPDMIEIASDGYLTLPDRNVFSANLKTAWPKMPRAAVRIAVDLDGVRHLLDEGLQMNGGTVPMAAQPAWQLVGAASTLRLGLDFSGDDLLWLSLTGRDAGAADQINGILGGLMAMAKQAGGGAVMMAPPKAQGPAKELLDALAATKEGNDVSIVLPHPEGLGDAIGEIVGQAFMAGMKEVPMGPDGEFGGAEFGGAELGGAEFGGADPFGAPPAPPGEQPPAAADPFGGDGEDPFGN